MKWLSPDWAELDWTPWVLFSLDADPFQSLPKRPGLYRVKPLDKDILIYVGETGRDLHERIRALCLRSLDPEMPFNDPHTAAPNLWAWRDARSWEYEVSCTKSSLSEPERKGLECLLLWKYRSESGDSALCNHGRFHPHYTKSKNSITGVRGGRKTVVDKTYSPCCQPPLLRCGEPDSADWMGLCWSQWRPLEAGPVANAPDTPGVYRIADGDEVIYLGESKTVRNRLLIHPLKKWQDRNTFRVSWSSCNEWSATCRKEIENDLIGAYYEKTRSVPWFQFGQNRK